MKRSQQPVICSLSWYFNGAPGRIRTRDPLLRRQRRSVAGCRLVSPCKPLSSTCCRWPSEDVAQRLPALAPPLAPRNLFALVDFE